MFKDYPVAPKKLIYKKNVCLIIISKMQTNITTGSVKKLVPNLMDQNNYVILCRNFQQWLEPGMKLKKIQRILKFK